MSLAFDRIIDFLFGIESHQLHRARTRTNRRNRK